MDSSKIPAAVKRLNEFMQELEKLNANLPRLKTLCQDWKEVKAFTDAVFYPVELLNYSDKRNEMELEQEAQEEVDCLLWELNINVRED